MVASQQQTTLNVFDKVNVPGLIHKGKPVEGTITFLTDCGKYAKLRYWKGSKELVTPFKVSDLKKIQHDKV